MCYEYPIARISKARQLNFFNILLLFIIAPLLLYFSTKKFIFVLCVSVFQLFLIYQFKQFLTDAYREPYIVLV